MKKYFCLIIIAFFFPACKISFDSQSQVEPTRPLFIKQPVPLSILPINQSITLTCEVKANGYELEYQWFESQDGTKETGIIIPNATNFDFTTPIFNDKEIHHYYCSVTIHGSGLDDTLLISDMASVACTGLPLMKIETVNQVSPSPAKEKVNGRMYLFKKGQMIYDSGSENEFSIKVRGNATAGYPKRPYKLKLPQKANLLAETPLNSSVDNDKNWVLLAGYCDKTLLRSEIGSFTASLFNELEGNEQLFVPRGEFVDVVLNGEYIGNYYLTDTIKEGKNRIPINEKETNSGGIGYIAEWDFLYYMNEPKWFESTKGYPYTFKFPETDNTNFNSYMTNFKNIINNFETSLYEEIPEDYWMDYIDLESFARWFLVQNILANIEPNYYFTKKTSDNSSKLVMGPVWDFEWSIGIGWYDGERPRNPDYWCVNDWYFEELLKKAEFITELKNQWAKLKDSFPDLAKTINNKMDACSEEIEISRKMNFFKWDILNQRISVGGIPLGSYEAELECDKEFISNRIEWLDEAINSL